ncbi:pseudouridylate synthase, putative [Phytophthora infestans T30-4]|uniref:Pseudouridylate synthase, putative n=1 Tax=Phytophthora infestans (strain T30-4) TaxID=403677 RepID=D0MQV6_PHYIT|nr:pseudouridylate synthase, putative [Phytophthora infestans T30-4]EEY57875.1 pseudouridylate synthase, putative [Phytophthora infestans T30-4]|eukprot:XP_002909061.1 pseudouridylate synthase, putative [Phytophthora infestans T30-4]
MVEIKLDGAVVGIEEFVNNHEGCLIVHGHIKTKPEDFVVREISAAGEVVDFSEESYRLPTETERDAILKKIEAQQKQKNEKLSFDEPADGWRTALVELIGAKGFKDVESVATSKTNEYYLASPTEFQDRIYLQVCIQLEHEDSKEARTALHRLIAKNSSSFKTKTEARNGIQRLVVHFMPKTNKKRKRSQAQVYLRFVLQKTNEEHFACFDRLARHLRRPLSAFSYAGTKDKAAVTFQHVVVTGVTPHQLVGVNSDESGATTGVRVGDLKYVETPMSLGGANGNRFSIVLRRLSAESECTAEMIRSSLESALDNIKCHGFVNYFGFQRVGMPSKTVRAHQIGAKIIAGKWEEALKLILTVHEGDSDDAAQAKRHYLESGDVEAALKLMPHGMSVERQLLQGLKRFGSDAFEQVVQSIPFSRRVMYMHAYQSYLFNRMASYRLRQYGAKIVAGDLIQSDIENDKAVKAVSVAEADELNNAHKDAVSLVLLPLPGTNVSFPSNATEEAYVKSSWEEGQENCTFHVSVWV